MTRSRFRSRTTQHGLWFAIAVAARGCAIFESPPVEDYKPYRERAETQVDGDLRVTVALPTAEEAAAIYGVVVSRRWWTLGCAGSRVAGWGGSGGEVKVGR